MAPKIVYFYQHTYLRDRQIDTIKYWDESLVLNKELATKKGCQVSRNISLNRTKSLNWKNLLPLINLKRRHASLSKDTAIYVWGGMMMTGDYIIELDNPLALTGYNVRALYCYRHIIKMILMQARCVEIRCISEACKKALGCLIDPAVMAKARVVYPYITRKFKNTKTECDVRFVFVSTQFEIKGGKALLLAFLKLYERYKNCSLVIVTHLPKEYEELVRECKGIKVYSADYSREEIGGMFLSQADVLVHPTYLDSFGMIVLEALSYGLSIISNDVYAINEMVINNKNGYLLDPPISKWDGLKPSKYFYSRKEFVEHVKCVHTQSYEDILYEAMSQMLDKELLARFKRGSRDLLEGSFIRRE